MHRFCGWLLRTKYYIKKGYDSIAVSCIRPYCMVKKQTNTVQSV